MSARKRFLFTFAVSLDFLTSTVTSYAIAISFSTLSVPYGFYKIYQGYTLCLTLLLVQ